jgi:hypothetical protein
MMISMPQMMVAGRDRGISPHQRSHPGNRIQTWQHDAASKAAVANDGAAG